MKTTLEFYRMMTALAVVAVQAVLGLIIVNVFETDYTKGMLIGAGLSALVVYHALAAWEIATKHNIEVVSDGD